LSVAASTVAGNVGAVDELRPNEALLSDLRGRSVRGGAVTFSAQAWKFLLQTGSTIVLARFLSPRDYGLVGMVTAITGFVAIFKDLGLSAATVQRSEITARQISTLFWINVAVSALLMAILAITAPAIAWVYGEPELKWVALALAPNFLLGGLTAQHQALLRRNMRFSVLAAIDVASMTFSVGVALFAAWRGLGYWSLVVMLVAQVASNAAMVWVASPWRPGRPSRGAGVGSMLKFGGNLTGFNTVNYFTRHADNILIGWYWGAGPLGLYAKAYQLLLLPLNQVAQPMVNVVLPALSRLQNDPARYRSYYQKAMLPLAFFSIPITVFMTVEAQNVVRVLLGEQWLAAAALFQLLGPAALVGGMNVATGWVYQSLGRTDRQLRWGLLASTVTVASFLIALPWGVWAVAAAFSATVCLLRYPSIVYCFRGTPLKPADLLSVLWRPLVAGVVAGACVFALRLQMRLAQPLVEMLIDAIAFFALYLAIWMLLPRGRQIMIELFTLVGELRRGPRDALPVTAATDA
jgi:O-antigen/teichoic acid export membrane protein